MATDPIDMEDGLTAVVARVREEIRLAGEDRASAAGQFVSPLGPEERDAVMGLLRDGTYHRAAARVGADDPDLADQ